VTDGNALAALISEWHTRPDVCRDAGRIAGDYVQRNSGVAEKIFREITFGNSD
jgi:hypothetical protein